MKFFTGGFVEIETVFSDEEWKEAETHRFVESFEEVIFRQIDHDASEAGPERLAVLEVHKRLTRKLIGSLRALLEKRREAGKLNGAQTMIGPLNRGEELRRAQVCTRLFRKLTAPIEWDLVGFKVRG
jgi:hypothetical protein